MSFIFGGDTGMSYEDVQAKQQRSAAIQQALARAAPRNVGEGLHAIGQALAARGMEKQASARKKELDAEWQEQVAGMGLDPSRAAIFGDLPYEQRASAALDWLDRQEEERRARASAGAAASRRAAEDAEKERQRQAIVQALMPKTEAKPGVQMGPTVEAANAGAMSGVDLGALQTTSRPKTSQEMLVDMLLGGADPAAAIGLIGDYQDIQPQAPQPELRTVGDTLVSVEGGVVTPLFQGKSSPLATASASASTAGGDFAQDYFEDAYGKLQTEAASARDMDGMLSVVEAALDSGVRTGFGAEQELQLRRLGQAIGVPVDDDAVAGAELLKSITNRMALLMRNPDSGMGMPGAVSDRDLTFLKDAQVGLDRSDAGNRNMLIAFRALNQRKQDIARLADEYVRNNNRLDVGFNDVVRRYAEENPLFTEETFTFGNTGIPDPAELPTYNPRTRRWE